MSSNHVKEPGSFSNLPLNTNNTEFKRPKNQGDDQSGWQNYPKELVGQGNNMSSQEEDNREDILEQLIAENASSNSDGDIPPTPKDPAESYDESKIPNLMAEDSQPHLYPQPQSGYPNHPLDATHHSSHLGQLAVSDNHGPTPQVFSASGTPIVELEEDKEPLKVEALERWLEKPVPEKENNSMLPVVMYSAACLMVVALTYVGIFISGSYKSFDGPLMQVAGLFGLSGSSGGTSQHTKSSSSSLNSGNGKNSTTGRGSGPSDGGNGGKKKVAAAIIAAPTLKTQSINCPEPNIKLSPLPGGRTQIVMNSRCRSNQTLSINYSGVDFSSKFDENGIAHFALDAFAGANHPISFVFEDGRRYTRHPVLDRMNEISKVAVIWDSPININLHAFEYAAGENSQGHIWEDNPQTIAEINQKVNSGNSGRGFISSASGASLQKKKKVEVYTFLHSPKQKNGVVKLALDYQVKTSGVQTVSCTSKNPAYVNYKTIRMIKNRSIEQHEGQLLIDVCKPITRRIYITKAVQDLDISN